MEDRADLGPEIKKSSEEIKQWQQFAFNIVLCIVLYYFFC